MLPDFYLQMNASRSTRRFFASQEFWVYSSSSTSIELCDLEQFTPPPPPQVSVSPGMTVPAGKPHPSQAERTDFPLKKTSVCCLPPPFQESDLNSGPTQLPPLPLGLYPNFSAFTVSACGGNCGSSFPSPAPTNSKCWPRVFARAGAAGQCAEGSGTGGRGSPSLCGLGLSLPCSFPQPHGQVSMALCWGPWARAWAWATLGLSALQEGLSCGCQLDCCAWGLAGPGQRALQV
jgi:hypothetical protein